MPGDICEEEPYDMYVVYHLYRVGDTNYVDPTYHVKWGDHEIDVESADSMYGSNSADRANSSDGCGALYEMTCQPRCLKGRWK